MTDTQLIQIFIPDAHFRADLRYDFFKVQNGDQTAIVFCNTSGYAILAAIDDTVRLFDFRPRDAVNSHNCMDMECKVRVIEPGNDKNIPPGVLGWWKSQITGQINDGQQHIPGFEDTFNVLLSLLHRNNRTCHHNFQYLCHIDAEYFTANGKFHDTQFIGT